MSSKEEKRTLCQTLWVLVKRAAGRYEYYYDDNYTLRVEQVDEVLTVFKEGEKIIGYNSEWGVLNWYGNEKDYHNLWKVISKHDEIYGFEWYAS